MARKRAEAAAPVAVAETDEPEPTLQARLELPTAEFERLRSIARSRGLSVSAFLRFSVLKEAKKIEEGRD
jgi:hypothetical protein